LPQEEGEKFIADVSATADAFVERVLAAEGRSGVEVDERQRSELREVVCDWLFDDGRGRNAKSGLPRVPPHAY
jgi:hypothetical protein